MAKQFQFENVKDFQSNFSQRAEGTIWIKGVKNPDDLKLKFRAYNVDDKFKGLKIFDDNCENYRIRFSWNNKSFCYLLNFREKYNDVQLEEGK